MGKVVALNRSEFSSGNLESSGELFSVYDNGTIEYTQKGLKEFSAIFRSCKIDIRKIQTLEDHEFSIKRSKSCKQGGSGTASELTDLDVQVIKALMNGTEDDVSHLEREVEIRDRISIC